MRALDAIAAHEDAQSGNEAAAVAARRPVDFDAEVTDCPACGASFATAGTDRCPECGLRFR